MAVRPVAGTPGVGDHYFPRSGNSGVHVTAYDIHIKYDLRTDRIEGHTTIAGRATMSLSRLDLRLPASAVTVNDHPARFQQDDGKLRITLGAPILIWSPVTVVVDYSGVPSAIAAGPDGVSPWIRTADGDGARTRPDAPDRTASPPRWKPAPKPATFPPTSR
jgi:hypothetical protein